GGGFITPSYFDLGNATLDMNNGGLTVGTTGGTISDWGGSGATTTATLTNNAVATYNSGLRMGVLGSGGTTNTTISGGARLVANESLSTGGEAASNVTLNVTGGRVESDGLIGLFRGTTTTVSTAGVIEGQNIVLGSSGGTNTTTVTGANSLLKARGTLFAGRQGTSTLTVSAGGKADSVGATIIGELAGANSTVNVTGAGSRLDVGSSLTVGSAGTGRLNIDAGGYVPVIGGVTVGSSGTLFLASGGIFETTPGQSIVNNGVVVVASSSQVRADVVNAGSLSVGSSAITRGVTLQSGSTLTLDNATVGSLIQQTGADIDFNLGSASNFDDLTVTGAASLAGDFVVTLGIGFTPTAGMTFPIFTAGSIVGGPNFDFSAATLPSGLDWAVDFQPTSLGLAVVSSGTPGDFDVDFDVDGRDFLKWQRGESTNPFSGGDLAAWQTAYNGGMLVAASMAVPEPPSALLAGMITVGLLICRNSRRTVLSRTSQEPNQTDYGKQ
ncbi:MAG: hypothetical protein SH868_09450, partial [Bythopirellula sp.]|nr:hypothetical protein [Bythopirellula sp.]